MKKETDILSWHSVVFSLVNQIKGYYFTKNDHRIMLVSVAKNVAG